MRWKALHLGDGALTPKNVGIVTLLLLLLAAAVGASWLLAYACYAMSRISH